MIQGSSKIMQNSLEKILRKKTILITGGTGSFGVAMTEKILEFNPKKVIIFSRDEKKQSDMKTKFNDKRILFNVGDIRDAERINHAMRGVDFVFHAAALKQIPSCEIFPMEAVKTNIIGSHNVIMASINNNVKKVILLSTDKAVNPISVMGETKAIMEKIMIATSKEKENKTIFCAARYGNIIYTRGSVVPLFVDLIKKGKPLEITEKEMTRFMMPMDQSIDLILHILIHGKNGEIYVKKSPSTTIKNLAEAMISIFSHKNGVKEIGIRPGDKKHETLISREEISRTKDMGDYFKIEPEFLDYSKKKTARPNHLNEYTSQNNNILSVEELKSLLLSLEEIKKELKKK